MITVEVCRVCLEPKRFLSSNRICSNCKPKHETISRTAYEALERHGYAGTENGAAWMLAPDENGATVLWKGLKITEDAI